MSDSLSAKQAELAKLKQIEDMSTSLVQQLEAVSENFDTLTEGTEVVADVLKRWNELLKVMAAKETQMILMPQSIPAAAAAATE